MRHLIHRHIGVRAEGMILAAATVWGLAALLVLAKSQQQQIDTLTGRLADLETRLAKLEA